MIPRGLVDCQAFRIRLMVTRISSRAVVGHNSSPIRHLPKAPQRAREQWLAERQVMPFALPNFREISFENELRALSIKSPNQHEEGNLSRRPLPKSWHPQNR